MIRVRRAQDKDIKRVTELLAQVLELHADLRPDLFIHGTTKYTENQLSDIFADEKTPVFVAGGATRCKDMRSVYSKSLRLQQI